MVILRFFLFPGFSVVGGCNNTPVAEFLSLAFCILYFVIVFCMEVVVGNVVRLHEFSCRYYLPQFISAVACTFFFLPELLPCESVNQKILISLCDLPEDIELSSV